MLLIMVQLLDLLYWVAQELHWRRQHGIEGRCSIHKEKI
jgi:hypothetical protein